MNITIKLKALDSNFADHLLETCVQDQKLKAWLSDVQKQLFAVQDINTNKIQLADGIQQFSKEKASNTMDLSSLPQDKIERIKQWIAQANEKEKK